MSAAPGRPSLEDVGRLIRARTKDSGGNELGTFDDETRPTDVQVEEGIDAAMALIQVRLPPIGNIPADLLPAVAQVVALEAACQIEKTYWPEQVRTDRSNYSVLKVERDEELAALAEAAAAAAGGSEYEMGGITMIPVGSWTSIPPGTVGWDWVVPPV